MVVQKRIEGLWRGERAYKLGDKVFVPTSENGSWYCPHGMESDFRPFTAAELNDPKNRALERVGDGYKGFATR